MKGPNIDRTSPHPLPPDQRRPTPQRDPSTLLPPEEIEQSNVAQVTMTNRSLFFLYDHDAPRDQEMETSWETTISGAYEGFLLPRLGSVQPWPLRCTWVGPNGWDLMDPTGKVLPAVVIRTRDLGRFVVGYANWSEAVPRSHGEHWDARSFGEQVDIEDLWNRLGRDYR